MTPDDIQKYVHEGIEAALTNQLTVAVQTAVDRAVNGKIKALDAKVTPMVEAYDKWLSARRLALIIIGVMIAIGGLVQSAQTIWDVVSHYFIIGVK